MFSCFFNSTCLEIFAVYKNPFIYVFIKFIFQEKIESFSYHIKMIFVKTHNFHVRNLSSALFLTLRI